MATVTPQHAVSVVNMESVLGHVPARDEPAPAGFFDWVQSLLDSNDEIALGVADGSTIPLYWNWTVEQHSAWWRSNHPGVEGEFFPGVEMHEIGPEDANHIVDFPSAAQAAPR